MTLCRIKDGKAGIRLEEAMEGQTAQVLGTAAVEQVIVYESQLTSGGPVYTAAASVDLQG